MKTRLLACLLAVTAAGVAVADWHADMSVMSNEYWKIWNPAVTRHLNAEIEKYRKADCVAKVGAPAYAEIKVEQISHAFFFGAHIFNFNQLGKKEWNERYKELYGTLFNSATVAFYWRSLEPYADAPRFAETYADTEEYWNREYERDPQALFYKPNWRRPAPDTVIDFCRGRHLRIHGHPLIWGNVTWHMPTWIWDTFTPESEKLALERATGVRLPSQNWRLPAGVKDSAFDHAWLSGWKKIFAQLDERQIAALVPSYVAAQRKFFDSRIRAIARRYGTRVDSWDVVNESATDWGLGAARTWPKGESAAFNKLPFTKSVYGLMPANYARTALCVAREVMKPSAWLNVNEYNMDAFPGQIADLEASGANFDVVGSQMHLFNPVESRNIAAGKGPQHLRPENIATRFARIAKVCGARPIHLSEITITAPDLTSKGQMVQAIILRNLYRAWFAVEKMNGITWWNVVDGCGALGEPTISGLFTRDMQPKTAYFAMDDLVNREWKTRLNVKAGADGSVAFRGFKGGYRLSWTDAAGKLQTRLVDVK